jgi:hypothetical protein
VVDPIVTWVGLGRLLALGGRTAVGMSLDSLYEPPEYVDPAVQTTSDQAATTM